MLVLCLAVLAAPQAYANDEEEIPEEYLQEADAFFTKCNNHHAMSKYLNCACMSATLLDERMENGPLVPQSNIRIRIEKECFDAINAAGPVYQECLKASYTFQPGTDPEKYCACVANTFVEAMNLQRPTIRSESINNFSVYAYTKCKNPSTTMPVPPAF